MTKSVWEKFFPKHQYANKNMYFGLGLPQCKRLVKLSYNFTMRLVFCIVILTLCAAIVKVVGDCVSKRKTSYNACVLWECGAVARTVWCRNLNDALEFSANATTACRGVGISIDLLSAVEVLQNEAYIIRNAASFKVVGTTNTTIVKCSKRQWLKFEGKAMSVQVLHVSLQNCGNGHVALSFDEVLNVVMHHIEVVNSNGTGVIFKNITGKVTVTNSSFTNSGCHGQGCSGIIIQVFSTKHGHNSEIKFYNCSFLGNIGSYNAGGGGLAAEIGGDTRSFRLEIESSFFYNNTAASGAGLHVVFRGTASENILRVHDTKFVENHHVPRKGTPIDLYNVGGGAAIVTSDYSISNKISFMNCSFICNNATWGGGLSFLAKPTIIKQRNRNKYTIHGCIFFQNTAAFGSALNLYCISPSMSPEQCNADPTLSSSSTFIENGEASNLSLDQSSYTTEATVHITEFPTFVKGKLHFANNIGSSLYVHNTVLLIGEYTEIHFTHNSASIGAGIVLYDSWMSLSRGCELIFINNTAFVEGGAIYAHQSADIYVTTIHDCFIRDKKQTTEIWDAKFFFSGNKVNTENNSIYATSIDPCTLNNEAFCGWKNWTFAGNCTDQIKTSVRDFKNMPKSVTMSPGVPKKIVVVVDDLGHEVTKVPIVPTLWPEFKGRKISVKYGDSGLVVCAEIDTPSFTVLIQVNGERRISRKINVTITDCPPGFAVKPGSMSCSCIEDKRTVWQCEGRNWTASIVQGYCMSFSRIHHKNLTVYGRCVFSKVWSKPHAKYAKHIQLSEEQTKLNTDFCGHFQ